jgi:RNA polymerase sigma-70 factor (ECF subfamily)
MLRNAHIDDNTLMQGICRGDEAALEALIHRHSGWGLQQLQRVLGRVEEAEDILQSCFVQIWEKAPAWEPQAQFRTWFYRVLYNRCMDHFRRTGREVAWPDTAPDGAQSSQENAESFSKMLLPVVPAADAGVMRRLDVQAALQKLPLRQRMAIVLVYFEELAQDEAAGVMGVRLGALESLLSRARATLARHLAAHRH